MHSPCRAMRALSWRLPALLSLTLTPLAVLAHSDEGVDIPSMDCEHPPADALRTLPEGFARWARILCLPGGHALAQSEDAQWRYPGSFTSKVMFPARSALDENDGKPRYFTRVQMRALEGDEARTQHQRLLRENPLYADRLTDSATGKVPAAPAAAWEVVGTNNAKVSYTIFLMRQQGAQEIWASVCAPVCEAQYTFIVTPHD